MGVVRGTLLGPEGSGPVLALLWRGGGSGCLGCWGHLLLTGVVVGVVVVGLVVG